MQGPVKMVAELVVLEAREEGTAVATMGAVFVVEVVAARPAVWERQAAPGQVRTAEQQAVLAVRRAEVAAPVAEMVAALAARRLARLAAVLAVRAVLAAPAQD